MFWKFIEREEETQDGEERKDKRIPLARLYTVFSMRQCKLPERLQPCGVWTLRAGPAALVSQAVVDFLASERAPLLVLHLWGDWLRDRLAEGPVPLATISAECQGYATSYLNAAAYLLQLETAKSEKTGEVVASLPAVFFEAPTTVG